MARNTGGRPAKPSNGATVKFIHQHHGISRDQWKQLTGIAKFCDRRKTGDTLWAVRHRFQKSCRICHAPENLKLYIERLLSVPDATRREYRDIAKEVGFAHTIVWRHRNLCMVKARAMAEKEKSRKYLTPEQAAHTRQFVQFHWADGSKSEITGYLTNQFNEIVQLSGQECGMEENDVLFEVRFVSYPIRNEAALVSRKITDGSNASFTAKKESVSGKVRRVIGRLGRPRSKSYEDGGGSARPGESDSTGNPGPDGSGKPESAL